MTFGSTIRLAAPLLLTVALAGCAVPYDDAYYGGNDYSGPYYGGAFTSGVPYYRGPHHHRGDVYAPDPSRHHRHHRTHRHHRHDGDGDVRRRHRAPEGPGLDERHRRDRAERRREERRAAAEQAAERAAERRRRERAAERAAAERRARRAERQAGERAAVTHRYESYRGTGETDAAFTRRVARAERQAERESMAIERILADPADPEK
ncbi:MAG: hypothetical protein ACE5EU_07785 [Paracoccaceae bacterium]